MPEKLDRNSWAAAVKRHRGNQQSGKSFSSQIQRTKPVKNRSFSGLAWKERIELAKSRPTGGRARGLGRPASKSKGRVVGGMLRNSIPRNRREISESQRQALPKTGNQTPKKGINASGWAYDHRRVTSIRREKASMRREAATKKGINAEKWHYDHAKARKAKTSARKGPTTHVSAEKKRTQREAMARHQPKQPVRPKQPQVNPKAPAKVRVK